ncbi:MFS transporter [Rhodovulum sp. DZ06]|uniref:MFS transporter n=1 Tax=Rhodovulum sp. DZ06 TaxID=3425126 RepID=UPI003D33CE31
MTEDLTRADAPPPRPAGRTPTAMPDPAPSGEGGGGRRASFGFVALMAALGAINAFSTDVVIPAMGLISDHYQLQDPNQRQWVLLALFVGVAICQLFIGPIADSLGRRKAAAINIATYLVGTILCVFAPSFTALLAGRVLQGLGSGGLRVISLAVTRDRYEGDEMARVVSLSSAVFVLIILLAPAMGQAVIAVADWRWLFGVLLVQAALTGAWFFWVQEETLREEHRRPLNFASVIDTFRAVLSSRWCMAHAAALSLVFGAFVSYLSTAQQVFGEVYALGAWLPAAFGGAAVLNGAAAMASAKWVRLFGARKVAVTALAASAVSGLAGAALFAAAWDGLPPFWVYMTWVCIPVAAFAAMYGNLSAVALIPMGARAGAASAVVSAMGSGAGVVFAWISGAAFDGTAVPLALAFGLTGLGAFAMTRLAGPLPARPAGRSA